MSSHPVYFTSNQIQNTSLGVSSNPEDFDKLVKVCLIRAEQSIPFIIAVTITDATLT